MTDKSDDEDHFLQNFGGEALTPNDSSCENWRARGNETPRPSDFSRFFTHEWRRERVEARHLKYCSLCKEWLVAQEFDENSASADGLQPLCIRCNVRPPRREATPKRDKYELFARAYKKGRAAEDEAETRKKATAREVRKRIEAAAAYASERYRRSIAVDPIEVSRKLFQRKRYICHVTGVPLTEACFLEHHVLTFHLKDCNRVEIMCSQCKLV